jgi:hypothetical protein
MSSAPWCRHPAFVERLGNAVQARDTLRLDRSDNRSKLRSPLVGARCASFGRLACRGRWEAAKLRHVISHRLAAGGSIAPRPARRKLAGASSAPVPIGGRIRGAGRRRRGVLTRRAAPEGVPVVDAGCGGGHMHHAASAASASVVINQRCSLRVLDPPGSPGARPYPPASRCARF